MYWVYTGRHRRADRWLGPFPDVPAAQAAVEQHAIAHGCPLGTFAWVPIVTEDSSWDTPPRGWMGMSVAWRQYMPYVVADETDSLVADHP